MRSNSKTRMIAKVTTGCWLMFAVLICGTPVLGLAQQDNGQIPLSDETAAAVKQVIQTLKRAALDNEPEIRATAITTLPSFANYDPEIVDILCAAVDSADPRIKLAGVQALLNCEEASEKIIDALLTIAADEQMNGETQQAVRARLAAIGAEAVVPRAMDAMLNGSPRQKSQAVQVLAAFGKDAQPAIDVLLQTGMNADEDVSLRTVALASAGQIMHSVAKVERKSRQLEARARNDAKNDFRNMDKNGDGKVATDGTEINRRMAEVMLEFDEDKDGFINVDELGNYYAKLFRDEASRDGYSSSYPSTSYGGGYAPARAAGDGTPPR